MFNYLSDHPEKAKYFYNAMRAFAKRPGLEPKYILKVPKSSLPILPKSLAYFDSLLCVMSCLRN